MALGASDSAGAAAPFFPTSAAYRGQSGFVLLEYDVSKDGEVIHPHAKMGWPGGEFDKAAVNGARRWTYLPPKTADGAPAEVKGVTVQICFVLRDRR